MILLQKVQALPNKQLRNLQILQIPLRLLYADQPAGRGPEEELWQIVRQEPVMLPGEPIDQVSRITPDGKLVGPAIDRLAGGRVEERFPITIHFRCCKFSDHGHWHHVLDEEVPLDEHLAARGLVAEGPE